MSIDNELKKHASDLAVQQERKASRLEHEAEEAQTIVLQKVAAAKAARLAHERLLEFSPRLGADLRCPRCYARGVNSVIKSSRARFIATGDGAFDEFRCCECGYELTVAGWGK